MSNKNVMLMTRTLGNGGAERVVSVLGNELSNKYKLYLVLFDASKNDYASSGEIIDLKTANYNKNILSMLFTVIKRVKKVRAFKNKNSIKTSISFLDSPNVVNLLSARNNKIILSIRNFKSEQNKGIVGLISSLSIKLFYNRADIIVVPSKLMSIDLIKNFNIEANKIKIIYNPYEIESIGERCFESLDSQLLKTLQNNKILITVGSLTPQKGHEYLIRIIKNIKSVKKNVKLLVIGKGYLESKLRLLTKAEGVENDVIFLGFQENPFKYISIADLFVFPSLFEGFPNALVEAMACKKTVVASDCKSGPREILLPLSDIEETSDKIIYAKYGILAPVFRPSLDTEIEIDNKINEWTKCIVNLLSNQELRSEYEKMAYIRSLDFDVKKIIREWEKII